jgi:cytosine/uracil/thiamine/allantoin permease
MLASLLPCIPGFVATFPGVDATAIPEGLQIIYSFSWFFCLVVSGAVYIVLERTVTPDYKKVRSGADSTDSSDVRRMKSGDAMTEGASTIV